MSTIKEPTEQCSDLLHPKPQKIPSHVAIIMDGNRRWARERGLPIHVGHWYGAEALSRTVAVAAKWGVRTLTVYAFSTENWKRSQEEVASIMEFFRFYLLSQRDRMIREGIRLGTIGDIEAIPQNVRTVLNDVKEATQGGTVLNLVIAINYGGRADLCRAIRLIGAELLAGRLRTEDVTEDVVVKYLDTAPWGDPELVIRTSGESRLSNFLLWESSYASLYMTGVLWPDFDEDQLLKAFAMFARQEKKLGS